MPPVPIPSHAAISTALQTSLFPDPDVTDLGELAALYFAYWPFDADWYLSVYPDVADAIANGDLVSAEQHFRSIGYAEGRLPHALEVDEAWYLTTYPDLGEAAAAGAIVSGAKHYLQLGYHEGRVPSRPDIDPAWYGPLYLPHRPEAAQDARLCEEHFILTGYRNGALPNADFPGTSGRLPDHPSGLR